MKKIIIIGKFNDITKEINDLLSKNFRVQLCTDSQDAIRGMLRLVDPDLIFISLVGSRSVPEETFRMLFREYPGPPIVVLGSESNEESLREAGFLRGNRIRFLRRPIRVEEIDRQIRELMHMSLNGPAVPSDKEVILVVDDNTMMLRAMQNMLSRRYKVTFATSGAQAFTAIAKERPALILLDYDMPVCNGKVTLQMLRADESTQDIPVIFLTGVADQERVEELVALRPQGYILKPPSEEKISTAIENALTESRKARAKKKLK